jgi:hypothetical protein
MHVITGPDRNRRATDTRYDVVDGKRGEMAGMSGRITKRWQSILFFSEYAVIENHTF